MLASFIDRCNEHMLVGWATDGARPFERLELDVLYRGVVIGSCVADRYRADLVEAGIADGKCGFEFPMPPFIPKGELVHVSARVHETGEFLTSRQPAPEPPRTHSRFGGLWIDRDDFEDELLSRRLSGEIAECITRFARDGYVILERAVAASALDRVQNDIDRFWVDPPPGLRIEHWDETGNVHFVPPDPALRGSATKLLDLHACSEAARQAIAAPRTMEFLHALFEEAPKAFQTLTFYRGSQQAIHKDTAYVKVDTSPMRMAATWLALEDVKPGSGELTYYVGSHRAPDFLFGGASKWMESAPHEHPRFLRSLHDDAERHGHRLSSFVAKRGDVLVWHADLAHGGAPITRPGQTRQSLVTHFTGKSEEPYYRRNSQHAVLEEHSCVFVSEHADVR